MTKPIPTGAGSVMATKRPRLSDGQPWQDAELFPTPPWATRAFMKHVFPRAFPSLTQYCSVWEPCAGLGHMSEVLRESFGVVRATDLHDYGYQIGQHNFMDEGDHPEVDFIVTNPPFGLAAEMLPLALDRARVGVAFLLRLSWQETEGRYASIFAPGAPMRPTLMAPYVERVPMCEGGYDPKGTTATAYSWFVWSKSGDLSSVFGDMIPTFLIPPGQKLALTERRDSFLAARFMPGWVPPSTLKKVGKEQGDLLCAN